MKLNFSSSVFVNLHSGCMIILYVVCAYNDKTKVLLLCLLGMDGRASSRSCE